MVYRCDASALPRLPFWFPITVPLGVISGDGTYLVNPEKSQLGGKVGRSPKGMRSTLLRLERWWLVMMGDDGWSWWLMTFLNDDGWWWLMLRMSSSTISDFFGMTLPHKVGCLCVLVLMIENGQIWGEGLLVRWLPISWWFAINHNRQQLVKNDQCSMLVFNQPGSTWFLLARFEVTKAHQLWTYVGWFPLLQGHFRQLFGWKASLPGTDIICQFLIGPRIQENCL